METLISSTPQTTEDIPTSLDDPATLDDTPDDDAPDDISAVPTVSNGRFKKVGKKFGRGAAIRAAAEVAGVGVDAALMGAGSAGIDLMKSVAIREITATAPEVAVIDRLMHHHGAEHSEQKARTLLKKMGSVAVGVTVAVVAQKAGLDVMEHVNSSYNHGLMHFAVPLTSKVGAMSGVNAIRRNLRF